MNDLGAGRKRVISRAKPERYLSFAADPNATTITEIGMGAATADGATILTSDKNEGPFHQHRTAGTTGTVTGVYSPASLVAHSWGFRLGMVIRTGPDIADQRHWAGVWDSTPESLSDPGSLSLAAFRYDTGQGDTTWQAYTGDRGSPSASSDTGVSVVIGTIYYMEIESDGTALDFYIDGDRVATISSVVPDTYMRFGWRLTTLANSVKRGFWSVFKLEY
jgi:hypothetical protein